MNNADFCHRVRSAEPLWCDNALKNNEHYEESYNITAHICSTSATEGVRSRSKYNIAVLRPQVRESFIVQFSFFKDFLAYRKDLLSNREDISD